MKVKELIHLLKALPPNTDVQMHTSGLLGYWPVLGFEFMSPATAGGAPVVALTIDNTDVIDMHNEEVGA